MATLAIATSRNNNGPYSQHINKPKMRQQKEQQLATKVLIQTNGEEPVTKTSRSSTSTPTTIGRRETSSKPTTSIPTTSKRTNSRRTSISFTRRDAPRRRPPTATHQQRQNESPHEADKETAAPKSTSSESQVKTCQIDARS
jgi:hypothetical protein